MEAEKPSNPVHLRPVSQDHRQAVLALRDLLIAADPYNRGQDHNLASAYHQARLVLAKNVALLDSR